MRRDPVITAIDLGTDKCVCLIASISKEDNLMRVMGVSAIPSKGMRRSVIIDLEQVLATLTESLDAAERMAGFDVHSCFLSVAGVHIRSRNSKGVVAVANPDQEITKEDVDRVIEAARAISLPADQQVIHVIPRFFKVDSQEDIRDPVGMTGVRLESEAHIITGMTTSLKNLEKCVNDLGLTVDGFVFSGLAASEVVLTETEKELGVMAVDIGAGTTSFCVYVDGSLELSGSVPIGARHITQDIALGCRISLDDAEKIKLALSSELLPLMIKPIPGESKEELNKRKKKADELDLQALGIEGYDEKLSRRTILEGIMLPRMQEIVKMITARLDDAGVLPLIPAGVVLTGGGAETMGMTEVVKKMMRLSARVGVPKEVQGLVSDIMRPSFATSIGVLVYGQKMQKMLDQQKNSKSGMPNLPLGELFGKLGDFFKSLLP